MFRYLLSAVLTAVLAFSPVMAETGAIPIQGGVETVDLPLSQADLIHLEIKEGFFDESFVCQVFRLG